MMMVDGWILSRGFLWDMKKESIRHLTNYLKLCSMAILELAAKIDDGSGIAKTLASVKDSMNQSAIHIAATEGRVNICKYWINDLKLEVDVQDAKGTTPLHRAILGGHMSTSVYLLEKHLILILQMIMGTLHCAAEKDLFNPRISAIPLSLSDSSSPMKSRISFFWQAGLRGPLPLINYMAKLLYQQSAVDTSRTHNLSILRKGCYR